MIILGIDPGVADLGYGLIDKTPNGKFVCLTYGSIKTPAKTDLATRLETLYLKLTEIIKKYKPEIAAVEDLFFSKNIKTAMAVGQARGIILLALKQNNIPFNEFTPNQVKQSTTAYGGADKKQMQKMVKLLLNLKEIPQPDDAADALAIAICAGGFCDFRLQEK